jgi:pimeloyl-ACP methyl ester carboxylesterase
MIQRKITHQTVKVRDLNVFYREAGPKYAPAVLLLHRFPTSSQTFRNLIPSLADRDRMLAPDYPGFGHSSMPSRDEFAYTFDNLAAVVEEFTTTLGVSKYALRWTPLSRPIASDSSLLVRELAGAEPAAVSPGEG